MVSKDTGKYNRFYTLIRIPPSRPSEKKEESTWPLSMATFDLTSRSKGRSRCLEGDVNNLQQQTVFVRPEWPK